MRALGCGLLLPTGPSRCFPSPAVLLEHTLALLGRHGVRDIAVNLHCRPGVITSYFSGVSGLDLVYSYEDQILGTAGAAKKLARYLDTTFFLIYGDVLTDLELSSLLNYHRSRDAQMTIVAYRVDEPTRCGIIEADASGRAISFVEKPVNPASDLVFGAKKPPIG